MPASRMMDVIVRFTKQGDNILPQTNQELNKLKPNATRLNRSLSTLRAGFAGLTGAVFSLKGAIAGIGLGLLSRSFLDAGVRAQKLELQIRAATGGVKEAEQATKLLREESDRLGLEFETQVRGYAKLAASAKGTALEGENIAQTWIAIAEAGAGLQLSSEEVEGAITAVSQIISKGKVSAEELRQQLGERLPGAFQVAARSMDVTTQELDKLLSTGALTAEEFIPRFAKQLREEMGGAAEQGAQSFGAAMNRMRNLWFEFRAAVLGSGLLDFIRAGLNTILSAAKQLRQSGELQQWAERTGQAVQRFLVNALKGFAALSEAVTFLQRAFEGIKIVLNALLFAFTRVVSEILGGAARLAKALGIEGFGGNVQEIADGFRAVSDVANNEIDKSIAKLDDLAQKQGQRWNQVEGFIGNVTKEAEKLKTQAEKPIEGPKIIPKTGDPVAKLENQIKAARARAEEEAKTQLATFQSQYEQGLISTQNYFDERERIMRESFESERDLVQKQIDETTDPDKRLKAETDLFKLTEAFKREEIKLTDERRKAELDLAQTQVDIARTLDEIRGRGLDQDALSSLRTMHELEMAELHRAQEEEIQSLMDKHATMAQIEEAYRLQQIERDQVASNQRKEIQEQTLGFFKQSLGTLSEAFGAAYEASGKKTKEFLIAQKTAAIFQTTISTYEAAQKAYSALAGIPIVGPGLAAAAAAAAIVGGFARIAAIRAQTFASGGMIKGDSPTDTADNINIKATAGEYVHPVKAVKYYGAGVMEAIRTMRVPRNVLSGYANVPNRVNRSRHYAAGGQVAAGLSSSAMSGMKQENILEASIFNINDPADFERKIATSRGRNALLNFMSMNKRTIRQVLS